MVTIGIVQIVEHAALDAARDGFIQALADNGFIEGENVTYDIQNAQGDQSTLSTIGDRFVSEDVDMILAIATSSAQTMASKTTTIPILGTAITDYEVAKLVDTNEVPGGNVSGTSDMNPIADQIALIFELFPDTETVGCIYNGGEDNSVLQAQIAKETVEARRQNVHGGDRRFHQRRAAGDADARDQMRRDLHPDGQHHRFGNADRR
jgi:putative ABC transport system substrate-binding protein